MVISCHSDYLNSLLKKESEYYPVMELYIINTQYDDEKNSSQDITTNHLREERAIRLQVKAETNLYRWFVRNQNKSNTKSQNAHNWLVN